jgi:hypothetical protein
VSADKQRIDQVKDLFEYGDEDTREIARAEMLASGTLAIEETVFHLDLASCVPPPDSPPRRIKGTKKFWNAIRSLERFINQKLRSPNPN